MKNTYSNTFSIKQNWDKYLKNKYFTLSAVSDREALRFSDAENEKTTHSLEITKIKDPYE